MGGTNPYIEEVKYKPATKKYKVTFLPMESCNEATDAEFDELDEAPGITPKSRLGCQTVPDGTTDIVVEIPEWNKNYAKELDH